MDSLIIYVLSDSIGETAQQVAKASISQFTMEKDYEIRKFPYIIEEEDMIDILEESKEKDAIVVYTLVDTKLQLKAQEYCQKNEICHVDLMSPMLDIISQKTGLSPKREPGIIRKLDESYFKRVKAIEFAVRYDDGKDPRGVLKADIVLLGISRTSKTPLSMYLANKNIKVANIPLVPEVSLPKEIYEINPKKIVGLTNSPEKLNDIRMERLKSLGLSDNASYAKFERIYEELDYANEIMQEIGCQVIDVSNKAIEESADIIIELMKH